MHQASACLCGKVHSKTRLLAQAVTAAASLLAVRPAGPLAVYKCGKEFAWIYILAELLAAVLACSIFAVVSGWGPLFPLTAMRRFNMTYAEAIGMFLTGGAVWCQLQRSGCRRCEHVLGGHAHAYACNGFVEAASMF